MMNSSDVTSDIFEPETLLKVVDNGYQEAHNSLSHASLITTILVLATLYAFKDGRRLLQRGQWILDKALGGASHIVPLPGPHGVPIFGSLLELQHGHVQKLAQWTKQYGDVFRVSFGEREVRRYKIYKGLAVTHEPHPSTDPLSIPKETLSDLLKVVINSHKAIAETVVRQGPAFQSRPTFKLFHGDYASSGIYTVASPFSDRLVRTRKAISLQIAPRALPSYTSVIHPKLRKLLNDVFEISQGPAVDMAEKLRRFGTGQVVEQLMGQPLSDDLVGLLVENEANIFRQRTIGAPLRDYVPILRAVGEFRSALGRVTRMEQLFTEKMELDARKYRAIQQTYVNNLISELKSRLESSDATPSILGNVVRQGLLTDEEVLLATYTGVASALNLGYSLTWIIGFLANRPDLQQDGFEAIRAVYEGGPPQPHEFDRVPYVRALYLEGSRIYTPTRLGFPRETMKGATYKNYDIPEKTLIVMNLFAANRDAQAFNRPDEFLPHRWLDGRKGRTDLTSEGGDKLGVPHLTYGAGRRVCPGIDMANRSLYSVLVLLLHFFTWERQPLDEDQRKLVLPPFRADKECSPEMDAILDTATPTEAQAIPWSAGIKFQCRDPEGLHAWLASSTI